MHNASPHSKVLILEPSHCSLYWHAIQWMPGCLTQHGAMTLFMTRTAQDIVMAAIRQHRNAKEKLSRGAMSRSAEDRRIRCQHALSLLHEGLH